MNATIAAPASTAARILTRVGIIVLACLLVSAACYGISRTPVSAAFAGPPGAARGGRGSGPAVAQTAVQAAPVTVGSGAAVGAAPADGASAAVAPSAPSVPPARPAGGGRPASLARGLPELGRNAGLIAILILLVTIVRASLRRLQRRHVASGRPGGSP